MLKGKGKYITIVLGFLLVTAPGSIVDWLALFKIIRGDQSMTINFGSWYNAIFPILGLGIIIFGIWWTRPNKEKKWGSIIDGAIVGRGFEFFPSRDILTKHYTLLSRVKSAPCVWALWHTGTSAWGLDAIKNGNIKRLILPHPLKAPLEQIADLVNKKPIDLAHDIIQLTEEVQNERLKQDKENRITEQDRITVLWYKGVTTNSIMIGNPEPLTDNSWVQVENLLPLSLSERPSFSLKGKHEPFQSLFEGLVTGYEELWKKAVPPEPISEQVLGNRFTRT